MSRYCPIVGQKMTYQFCEDCDEKICRNKTNQRKNNDSNNNNDTINHPVKIRHIPTDWV